MKKQTKESLLELIPTLIRNIQYETELIQILTNKYKYTDIRIGDIRKLLLQLGITLSQSDNKKKKESILKTENKKRERRNLTNEELRKKSEERRIKYQDVIGLLITDYYKFSYRDIANICNVSIGTVARVKKEFIDNIDRCKIKMNELETKIAMLDCNTCVNFNTRECKPYDGLFQCNYPIKHDNNKKEPSIITNNETIR